MNDNQLAYTYDDDQPWITLCIPKTERQMKARIKDLGAEMAFHSLYHVEPLARYRYQPPTNKEWQPLGITNSCEEALMLSWADMEVRYPRYFKTAKAEQSGQQISRTIRFKIMRRDGFRCQLCGRTADDGVTLEVDHVYPKARGGTNEPDNLWTLCFDCNRAKRDTILEGTE